ncbi:hypothetical protein BJY04DRAFT_53912 [Aspergillus karnatakaensis]|uniref:uncharacterized protein n=1 Tax=Aspergillus karnatakaensis TaxID=1810916 RepID=UPI003CCDBDE6
MTKILDAPARTDPRKRVGAVIKPDIFVKEGTHSDDDNDTLFPFLVLEAKRAKAPDSLEDIERQMALPAYEMLRTQKQLIESSSSVQAHTRLPRVWLVSFKAQIWKLYVGTMERGQNDKDAYNIYNVWSGDVSGKQDALKLVLLLDCIFDWGLDIYRLDIHERLESMMAFDPRLRRENIAPTVSDISEALEMMTMTPHLETPETISEEVMDVIKFNNGWFRDARRVLDSGGGLLITAANIADIFDNFEHPDHAKRFARLLWELLEHRPLVFSSESVLDRIRENWTGERYNRQPVPESETRIYMQLEVYVYLDLNWQPTRRLIFVAITEDSMSELFSRAQPATFTSWEELYGAGARLVSVDRLLEELRDFREELSASETLQEAIRRWHHRLDYSPTGRGELEWESVTMPSCDKAFHEIFSTYQVGKRQPSESFLKIWHSAQPTVIAEPEDRSLLIAGHTDERDWHRVYRRNRPPRLCIFVFEDLDDYHPRQTAKTLRYWQRQAEQQLGCDYTVLRGNYFSGSTHFDDNRSESEYITPWGAVFPRNLRRAMLPSPASLIDRWIENLDGRGTYEDSDDQEYHTDDSDHRGDGFGGLGTESVSLDEDGEEGADTATEDDEADTHSGEDSEGEEASSSSSEDDDSSDDDDW